MSSAMDKMVCALVWAWTALQFLWTVIFQPGFKFAIEYFAEWSIFKVTMLLLSPISDLYAHSSSLYVATPSSSQWVAHMSAVSLSVKSSVTFAFVVAIWAAVESVVYDPSLLWPLTPKELGNMFVEAVRIFSIVWYCGWWGLRFLIWSTENGAAVGHETGVVRESQYEKRNDDTTAGPMLDDGKDNEDGEETQEDEEKRDQKSGNVLKKTLVRALTLVEGCSNKVPEHEVDLVCPPSPIRRSDLSIKPFDASNDHTLCVSLQKYASFNRVSAGHHPCAFEVLEYEREKHMLNKVLATPPKTRSCWNTSNTSRNNYGLANLHKDSSRMSPISPFPEKLAWMVREEKEMKAREMRLETLNPLHSEMLKKNIFGTWNEAIHKYYWEEEEAGPRYNFA